MNGIRRRQILVSGCLFASLIGCQTESKYDRLEKRFAIPGTGIVDEYGAQKTYKKEYGHYPDDGSKHVREVLERQERSRQHYGGD